MNIFSRHWEYSSKQSKAFYALRQLARIICPQRTPNKETPRKRSSFYIRRKIGTIHLPGFRRKSSLRILGPRVAKALKFIRSISRKLATNRSRRKSPRSLQGSAHDSARQITRRKKMSGSRSTVCGSQTISRVPRDLFSGPGTALDGPGETVNTENKSRRKRKLFK